MSRAVFTLSLLLIAPVILAVLAGYYSVRRISEPTDAELTARFSSHQQDFDTLAKMLDSDRHRLLLNAGPVDLANLVAAAASTPHAGNYEAVLAGIGVKDFRYFPQSGNVVLPVSQLGGTPASSTKSYLYLSRDDPQPLLHHRIYGWRGPGMYFESGDYRIEGRWFIHHERTVSVAFAPY